MNKASISVWFLWFTVAICSLCCAQYAEPVEFAPVQTIETLPWSEVESNDFEHQGEGFLIDHLRNHPMLGDQLEKLHEWLHQRIEKLRPRDSNGNGYSTVFVEATDAQFESWAERQAIEAAGWKVVRLPVGQRLVNVVAIGKMHFSHAGHLTIAALQKFVNQVENRKFKPIQNARARYVQKLTMFTRNPCAWCDKWMAEEYPQAIADGATVEFVIDANGTVPRFETCDESGQCRQFTGFTAWRTMRAK